MSLSYIRVSLSYILVSLSYKNILTCTLLGGIESNPGSFSPPGALFFLEVPSLYPSYPPRGFSPLTSKVVAPTSVPEGCFHMSRVMFGNIRRRFSLVFFEPQETLFGSKKNQD